MFACYVQECQQMFVNSDVRKDHCITVHKFPHNFRFDVKPAQRNGKSVNESDNLDGEVMDVLPVSVDETIKPMKGINFGHSKVKTFKPETSYAKILTKNQKKKSETQILDDNKMIVDLMASLPE